MTFVLFDRAQHTDAHLVGAAVQLQALLMLGADLPVQVADFIHQLVPFKGGRLKMGLEMFLAVGGQAHQTGLHRFVLLADADVAAHVLGPCVIVVRGRRGRWKGVARQGGVAGASYASRGRSLVVGDPALGAEVGARVVSMVPVRLQANGAENMSTWDGDGVPQVLLAQVAAILVGRHGGKWSAVSCCAAYPAERAGASCQPSGKVSPQPRQAPLI